MDARQNLFEYLNDLCIEKGFSIGFHTTRGQDVAESICQQGLYIEGGRKLEGTLKIRGYAGEFRKEDVNWFFDAFNTDSTVVVAIPPCFEAKRIYDGKGGNEILCGFSLFLEIASKMGKIFPEFSNEHCHKIVPPQFVLGYYDKDFNFKSNSNCWVYEDHKIGKEKGYVQGLKERIDENHKRIEIGRSTLMVPKETKSMSFGPKN